MARPRRGQANAATESEADRTEADSQPEEEDEEDGGFEVDEILNVRRQRGKNGALQYYVRWKGYGQESDSWEPEENTEGAAEAVALFWKTHPELTDKYNVTPTGKPRKKQVAAASSATPKTAKAAAGGPKANGKETPHTAPPDARTKRRPLSDSPTRSPSYVPAAHNSAPQPPRKRKRDTDDEPPVDDHTMAKYMSKPSWESLVARVDDVAGNSPDEKPKKGLRVYLKLTDGSTAVTNTEECNKRCPQKMLRFYESKLKFRVKTDDDDDEED
ncbi:hypothetical protein CALVIDRAFT_558362 [Calocera viscosa TUFC12733]|uniref:Chromo domain-containing protein n=1 Tax=Calocera viscosa (strain TUFC12733) TaxID=1330018 RepID=A0A167H0B3_CALVF|nr:hypothetical protein CALVIDRAFT_558362 [Calocera viscosa TUFC12733]